LYTNTGQKVSGITCVHPQIKCGGYCTDFTPLGKVVIRLHDLKLNDEQGTVHTSLFNTERRVSVSDAVRADFTIGICLEDCLGWSGGQFYQNARAENIKHFK
jgi:hypothetical protein